MKWLVLMFVALVGTVFGIMFTEGTTQFVFQIAFFCTMAASFVAVGTGMA